MKRTTSGQGDKIRTVHNICCEFSRNRICTILAAGVLQGGSSVVGLVLAGIARYCRCIPYWRRPISRSVCVGGVIGGSPLLRQSPSDPTVLSSRCLVLRGVTSGSLKGNILMKKLHWPRSRGPKCKWMMTEISTISCYCIVKSFRQAQKVTRKK